MENYTAVVLEPYQLPGKKDVRGIPMVEPELLKKAVTQLDADGFQVPLPRDRRRRGPPGARCDRGRAHGERRPRAPPPHLAHPADPPGRPAALPEARRRRELPAAVGVRGRLRHGTHAAVHQQERGVRTCTRSRAWRRAARSSPSAATGRCRAANPFEEMETAITRMGALGDTTEPFLPEERITLPEALAAFTINAAYTNRDEKNTGSLEVGKRANLAVLDRNLFEIPPTEISDTKVLVTLFEGKPVHGDLGALVTEGAGRWRHADAVSWILAAVTAAIGGRHRRRALCSIQPGARAPLGHRSRRAASDRRFFSSATSTDGRSAARHSRIAGASCSRASRIARISARRRSRYLAKLRRTRPWRRSAVRVRQRRP